MAVPVLLVTGYLGAGKTTLVNHLLSEPHGRRLAVLMNDFGAIGIDAALLASATHGVVSLANGCICCSLQGDLLRALSSVLRRDPAPDGIVIETSGVSDPAEIVRSLLDPVIWREAALDAVICVADARSLADTPSLLDGALCRSQIRAADFVALNKTDLVGSSELAAVRASLCALKPSHAVHEIRDGRVAPELLFSAGSYQPGSGFVAEHAFVTPGFQSVSWTAQRALSLPLFQAVIGRLAGRLVRAKGIVRFAEHGSRPMVFQLVGERATIVPGPRTPCGAEPVRLVFIARAGALDEAELASRLAACVTPGG